MVKPPVNPILPEHRVIFESYLLLWQQRLGLQGWRIALSEKKPTKANAAEVKVYHKDRLASVRLGDDMGAVAVTPETLEAFAIHELLHVLLYPLVGDEAPVLEDEALEAAEHSIIHVVQHLLTRGRI